MLLSAGARMSAGMKVIRSMQVRQWQPPTSAMRALTVPSGKSVYYSAGISDEDFTHITGYAQPFTYEHSFSLFISCDMYVQVNMFTRKTPAAQWKCLFSVCQIYEV